MWTAVGKFLTIVGFMKKWKEIETAFQKTDIQYVLC